METLQQPASCAPSAESVKTSKLRGRRQLGETADPSPNRRGAMGTVFASRSLVTLVADSRCALAPRRRDEARELHRTGRLRSRALAAPFGAADTFHFTTSGLNLHSCIRGNGLQYSILGWGCCCTWITCRQPYYLRSHH